MSSITLSELQQLELEIAKEIKRVCDENRIDYFIIAGTLLGAVRHKGFIPWDDDIDIGMTLNNYERFLKIAPQKMDERFFVQTNQTDVNYHNMFAKVRLRSTHMIEKVTQNTGICDGIFVDVFPYYEVSEKRSKSRSYLLRLRLLGKISLLKHSYDLNSITESSINRFVNNFLKWIPVSVDTIDKILESFFITSSCENSNDYYIERNGIFRGNCIFPKSYFEEFIELPFEGVTFKAPKQFDHYLSKLYGKYMEYPPEEERKKGHSLLEITLDKDFSSYLKK